MALFATCCRLSSLAGLFVVFLTLPARVSSAPTCKDAASCQANLADIKEKLLGTAESMKASRNTLQALENLRNGIISGDRIELAAAERQHLEKGSSVFSEISYDAKHRPVSTNVSRHLQYQRTIGSGLNVRMQIFMPLKSGGGRAKSNATGALLLTVDKNNKLGIFTLDGESLLEPFDLGHEAGTHVTQIALSPSQDNHFVLTADNKGEMRVHNLKVISRKAENKTLEVSTNFSVAFSIPNGADGQVRKLTAVLPVDRGTQMHFVTGDDLGGLSVFYKNGTLKGRAHVTEDAGGIKGLVRGQGQTVLFFSSHMFGFFSVPQIDVQYLPCSGWNSPLFDVSFDPVYSYNRVILALEDGDVLIFSTQKGKSKACDLTLKFPKVSSLPFRLNVFKGHAVALATLDGPNANPDILREMYFFNMGAMEKGYGTAQSRTVALQVSFKPKRPEFFSLYQPSGTGDRNRALLAIRFEGQTGVEMHDLSLKQPPTPKAAAEASGEGSWFDWFPKIGVFGIALIGVVIWNVRKATATRRKGGLDDDVDMDFLKSSLGSKSGLAGLGKGMDDDDGLGGLGSLGKDLGGMGGLAGLSGLGGDDGDDS